MVVFATQGLVQLYRQEPKRPPPGKKDNGKVAAISGRRAFAERANEDERDLRRSQPLAEAEPEEILAAIERVKKLGHGVTTTTVLRALTTTSGQAHYDGDEWYTPAEIIVKVTAVLGVIDLAPASNAHAQATIKAASRPRKESVALPAVRSAPRDRPMLGERPTPPHWADRQPTENAALSGLTANFGRS